MLVFLGLITFSCNQKEQEIKPTNNESVRLIENQEYGNYLSFKSKKDIVNKILEWKDDLNVINIWLSQFKGFTPLREGIDIELASLLNQNGYIMADKKLYRQVGEKVYLIKNKKPVLLHTNSNERISSCKNRDVSDGKNGFYDNNRRCYTGYIGAHIDYYKSFWGCEKVILNSRTKVDCQYNNAYVQHQIDFAYDINIDGIDRVSSGSVKSTSRTHHFKTTLIEGDDICIGYIRTTHKGSGGDWFGSLDVKLRLE